MMEKIIIWAAHIGAWGLTIAAGYLAILGLCGIVGDALCRWRLRLLMRDIKKAERLADGMGVCCQVCGGLSCGAKCQVTPDRLTAQRRINKAMSDKIDRIIESDQDITEILRQIERQS